MTAGLKLLLSAVAHRTDSSRSRRNERRDTANGTTRPRQRRISSRRGKCKAAARAISNAVHYLPIPAPQCLSLARESTWSTERGQSRQLLEQPDAGDGGAVCLSVAAAGTMERSTDEDTAEETAQRTKAPVLGSQKAWEPKSINNPGVS